MRGMASAAALSAALALTQPALHAAQPGALAAPDEDRPALGSRAPAAPEQRAPSPVPDKTTPKASVGSATPKVTPAPAPTPTKAQAAAVQAPLHTPAPTLTPTPLPPVRTNPATPPRPSLPAPDDDRPAMNSRPTYTEPRANVQPRPQPVQTLPMVTAPVRATPPRVDEDRPGIVATPLQVAPVPRTPAPAPAVQSVPRGVSTPAMPVLAPKPLPALRPPAPLPAPDEDRSAIGSARPAPRVVTLDPVTSVLPRNDQRGVDIRRKVPDGSQLVISRRTLPDGRDQVSGYRQIDNPANNTLTRIYPEGFRWVQGRDYDQRWVGSGFQFVTRHDGLRTAHLPDGRPAYRDRYVVTRDPLGRDMRYMERTRYVTWWRGHPHHEVRPIRRRYDLSYVFGIPIAYYLPTVFSSDFYSGFYTYYARPVFVSSAPAVTGWLIFDQPTQSYTDPIALAGDLQITTAFEEGYAYAAPDGVAVYDTPEAAALRAQMASVQSSVDNQMQGNEALRLQLGTRDWQAASAQVQQGMSNAVPVHISEEIRQQIRQQVRLSVAMSQNAHPMLLKDLLVSGYASIYLFQVSAPLKVSNAASATECFLNTGDLLSFAAIPTTGMAEATMRVVAAQARSCAAGEQVQIGLGDLQDMLNGFSERVEDNLRRVSACAASGRC